MQVGQTQRFTVRALDQFENLVPVQDYSYVFTANHKTGQIDREGNFIAGTTPGSYEGAVTVTVMQGTVTGSVTADVTIVPGPLDHVLLEPADAAVRINQARRFTATGFDRIENPIPDLTYVFSGKSRAGWVRSSGTFSAGTRAGIFPGEVTVRVTQGPNGKIARANVTVETGPLDQLEITPNSLQLAAGSKHKFVARATDRYGNEISGHTLEWAVGVDDWTIDSDGTLVAESEPGTYPGAVTVKATKGAVTRSATADVIVRGFTAVSAGGNHTCAVTWMGGVMCWGANKYGQLGDGTQVDSPTPVGVEGITDQVTAVSAGHFHTCALTTEGGLKCWGWNEHGQLGDGTTGNRATPVDVVGVTGRVAAVSAASTHNCALTAAGGVKCWGSNRYGQVGRGSFASEVQKIPGYVIGLESGVAEVSSGGLHSCVVMTSGRVKCWGSNRLAHLGDGTSRDNSSPVDVVGLSLEMTSVAAGYSHTCSLSFRGGVFCWGFVSGLLGYEWSKIPPSSVQCGKFRCYTPAKLVGINEPMSAISGGSVSMCALMSAGGIQCAGQMSGPGRVKRGDLTNAALAVSSGAFHVCFLTAIGAIKCW